MGLNFDSLKKRKEEMDKGFDDNVYYNLQDGSNEVRVLPRSMKYFGKGSDDDFVFKYWVHYGLFEVPGFKMIVCRKKTLGESCPICDYVRAKKLTIVPKERFIYNVLDLAVSEKIIKVMSTGPQVYQRILDYVLHPKCGDVFAIETGRDITIEKTPGNKSPTGWTNYTVIPSMQASDCSPLLPDDWQDVLDTLEERGTPYTFNEQQMEELVKLHQEGGDPKSILEGTSAAKRYGAHEERVPAASGAPAGPKENMVTRTAPAPVSRTAQEKTQVPMREVTPSKGNVQQAQVQEPLGEIPDCYGEGFSFKDEKCKPCAVRVKCKKIYFEKMDA